MRCWLVFTDGRRRQTSTVDFRAMHSSRSLSTGDEKSVSRYPSDCQLGVVGRFRKSRGVHRLERQALLVGFVDSGSKGNSRGIAGTICKET
jgi:hypothetical protein